MRFVKKNSSECGKRNEMLNNSSIRRGTHF